MNERRSAGGHGDPPHGGGVSGPPAPPPLAADVGIVAALGLEVGFLIDRLGSVRKYSGPRYSVVEGQCAGKLVSVLVTGPGRAAARRGAELLLAGHRPGWLLSVGFA